MVKQFYLTHRWDYHVLPLQVRVDLREVAIKEYFKFPKNPGLELHYQMQFTVIPRTLTWGGEYWLSADMQLVDFIIPTEWAISFPSQSRPESNGNKGSTLHTHTFQISQKRASHWPSS